MFSSATFGALFYPLHLPLETERHRTGKPFIFSEIAEYQLWL